MPASLCFCSQIEPASQGCSQKFLQQSISVDEYLFKTYGHSNLTEESACFEILLKGKVMIRKVAEGGVFTLGQKAQPEYGVPAIVPGTDLTGRGHPDMFVSYYSGGAHCCTRILLFELKPDLRLLATLETGDSDIAHFERDSRSGGYSFIQWDGIFSYWHACFACSPVLKVILKPQSDDKGDLNFRLDLNEMRKEPPTEREWREVDLPQARAAFAPENSFDNYFVGSDLWKLMLNWIYGGQADLAWRLVDEAWPAQKAGRSQFLKDFCGQLARSEYWNDLHPQIGSAPAACSEGFAGTGRKPK
jgi:hypothetical protein